MPIVAVYLTQLSETVTYDPDTSVESREKVPTTQLVSPEPWLMALFDKAAPQTLFKPDDQTYYTVVRDDLIEEAEELQYPFRISSASPVTADLQPIINRMDSLASTIALNVLENKMDSVKDALSASIQGLGHELPNLVTQLRHLVTRLESAQSDDET